MQQFLAVALIFVGELLAVGAEMVGARDVAAGGGSFWLIFSKMFGVMALGGALLVGGYMLGYRAFQNIWIVTAVSIGSILLVEPILAWTLFHELPTRGAVVGIVLGVGGILSALFL